MDTIFGTSGDDSLMGISAWGKITDLGRNNTIYGLATATSSLAMIVTIFFMAAWGMIS
ncbi:hypothetical protein [Pelagibius sp. Alg239-R121]|uniref:hypothetical protein n=1 Tax=Pelagibius sp. Alg239-R121 TaxID=2993448 RepID=UPI0024A6723C|nr:hypothetical protein [Pelagibius sp. Alg239-R121]